MRAFGNPLGNPIQDGAGAGRGAAIGDIRYLLPNEVTDGYLPPDGRRIYRSDYPGLAGVLREYLEGDTLNWVKALDDGGTPFSVPDCGKPIAVLDDGRVVRVLGNTTMIVATPNGSGGFTLTTVPTPGSYTFSTIAVVPGYVAFGGTDGRVVIVRQSDLNNPLINVFPNGQSASVRHAVFAHADRWFISGGSNRDGSAQPNLYSYDTQGSLNPASFSINGGNGWWIRDVTSIGTLLLVSLQFSSGGGYIFPYVYQNGSFAQTSGTSTGVDNGRIRVNAAKRLVFIAGDAGSGQSTVTFYKYDTAGNWTQIGSSLTGQTRPIRHMDYDEQSDTLIVAGDSFGAGSEPRRLKGKVDKAIANQVTPADFETIAVAGMSGTYTFQTYALVVRNAQWFAQVAASADGSIRPLIRAGGDSAKPSFNLPKITVANTNDRADGKSPYVRVR